MTDTKYLKKWDYKIESASKCDDNSDVVRARNVNKG